MAELRATSEPASSRVVVTGIGLTCPVGNNLKQALTRIRGFEHGIRFIADWQEYAELQCFLGAPISEPLPKHPRRVVRTMGRVAELALYATEQALQQARFPRELLGNPTLGLSYGSTHGSTGETQDFCTKLFGNRSFAGIAGSSFPKFMSHTCAANLAQHYTIRGRVVPVVSACTSGSQCIGVGYELIRSGLQEAMICGGAEELHVIHAGVFDLLYAASTRYNQQPEASPRPFDRERDGLVVGEGAATLVLESLSHAQRRGAPILAELIGYASNCDGGHITAPTQEGMVQVMRSALSQAQLEASDVDYVNAHATATELGDIVESQATAEVFGQSVPVSSTKGYTGHTLGACGALESAFCIGFMSQGWLPASRNLQELDSRCAALDYITQAHRDTAPKITMNNNFAFGGINTSIVLRSAHEL